MEEDFAQSSSSDKDSSEGSPHKSESQFTTSSSGDSSKPSEPSFSFPVPRFVQCGPLYLSGQSQQNCDLRLMNESSTSSSSAYDSECSCSSCFSSSSSETSMTERNSSNTESSSSREEIKWSTDELVKLSDTVQKILEHGSRESVQIGSILMRRAIDWRLVASLTPGKTESECEKAWNAINPQNFIRTQPDVFGSVCRKKICLKQNFEKDNGMAKKKRRVLWTKKDIAEIEALQKEHGNRWTLISRQIQAERTPKEIKNFWNNRKYRTRKKTENSQSSSSKS